MGSLASSRPGRRGGVSGTVGAAQVGLIAWGLRQMSLSGERRDRALDQQGEALKQQGQTAAEAVRQQGEVLAELLRRSA